MPLATLNTARSSPSAQTSTIFAPPQPPSFFPCKPFFPFPYKRTPPPQIPSTSPFNSCHTPSRLTPPIYTFTILSIVILPTLCPITPSIPISLIPHQPHPLITPCRNKRRLPLPQPLPPLPPLSRSPNKLHTTNPNPPLRLTPSHCTICTNQNPTRTLPNLIFPTRTLSPIPTPSCETNSP